MCKYCEIFTHILYCNMFAMNVILKHVCVVVLNLAFCSIYAICRKFAFVAIYALFRVKFLPQKLWSCKFVDKYHVWLELGSAMQVARLASSTANFF